MAGRDAQTGETRNYSNSFGGGVGKEVKLLRSYSEKKGVGGNRRRKNITRIYAAAFRNGVLCLEMESNYGLVRVGILHLPSLRTHTHKG